MSIIKNENLQKNIFSLFILQGANTLLPLAALPYLARTLGVENFGHLIYAQAIIQFFIIITDYGFNLSAQKEISIFRQDKERISTIFINILAIKLSITLVGFFVLIAGLFFTDNFLNNFLLYSTLYLNVIGTVLFPMWLWQGLERIQHIIRQLVIARVITLIMILILVKSDDDYIIAALLLSTTLIISSLLTINLTKNTLIFSRHYITINTLKSQIINGWSIFKASLAINLYTTSTTVILGYFSGPVAVAYFAAAEKIIKIAHALSTPITQALYPHLAFLTHHDKHQSIKVISKLLYWQTAVSLTLSITLFLLAPAIISLVFGESFSAAILCLEIMAFLPVIVSLSNIFGTQTMINFDMQEAFGKILLVAALANLTILPLFVIELAELGASLSMVLIEISVTVAMMLTLNHTNLLLPILGHHPKDFTYEKK